MSKKVNKKENNKSWVNVIIPKNAVIAESEKSVLINLGDLNIWVFKKYINKPKYNYEFLDVYYLGINIEWTYNTDLEKKEATYDEIYDIIKSGYLSDFNYDLLNK